MALQAQSNVSNDQLEKCQNIITHLKTRHVPHPKDPDKDNIAIEKNTAPEKYEFCEYSYFIVRIQRCFINTKRRWFKAQHPHRRFIMEELDNANSIERFSVILNFSIFCVMPFMPWPCLPSRKVLAKSEGRYFSHYTRPY